MPNAQQVNEFIAQPINNLLVFLAIVSVFVVLLAGFTVYKFGPAIVGVMKSIAETLVALRSGYDKLIDMKADTVEWQKAHSLAVENLREDTSKHLIALTQNIKTRSELDGQAFDEMRDEVGKKIDENNEAVMKRITALEDGVNKLNTSVAGIQNCESFTTEIMAMEARIMAAIHDQAKRETATTLPANVTVDDAGAGSEAAA